MSRSLKLFITGLVGISAAALMLTSFVFAWDPHRIFGLRPEIAIDYNSKLGVLPDTPAVLGGVVLWLFLS